ncbi:hypothetical protein ACFQV4_16815 [Streptomyces thermocarboxydus]
MTAALTTPAAPAAARPAGVPRQWRWLARLQRPALIGGGALVLLTAAALVWLGGPLTDASAAAWKAYNACGFTPRCSYDQSAILLYKDVYNYVTFAVLAVPFLVAAWAGGALVGRETESGTARLAWTQGSPRPAGWRPGWSSRPCSRSPGPVCWRHCTAGPGRRAGTASTPPSPGTTRPPSTPTASSPWAWRWPVSRRARWPGWCCAARRPRWPPQRSPSACCGAPCTRPCRTCGRP